MHGMKQTHAFWPLQCTNMHVCMAAMLRRSGCEQSPAMQHQVVVDHLPEHHKCSCGPAMRFTSLLQPALCTPATEQAMSRLAAPAAVLCSSQAGPLLTISIAGFSAPCRHTSRNDGPLHPIQADTNAATKLLPLASQHTYVFSTTAVHLPPLQVHTLLAGRPHLFVRCSCTAVT